MFGRFVQKAKNLTWKVLGWIWGFIFKFKKMVGARIFNIIVIGLAILAFCTIIMIAVNYFKKLFAKSEAQGSQPLCAQAIGIVTEAEGGCIVAGEVLEEDTYNHAMGLLAKMKNGASDAEKETYSQAQASLTQCYEAAKEGQTVQLREFSNFFNETEGYSGGAVIHMRKEFEQMEVARQEASRMAQVHQDAIDSGALDAGPETLAKVRQLKAAFEDHEFFDIKERLEGYGRLSEKGKEEGTAYVEHFMKVRSTELELDLVTQIDLGGLQRTLEDRSDEEIQATIDDIMANIDEEGGQVAVLQMVRNFNELGRDDLADPIIQQLKDAGRVR